VKCVPNMLFRFTEVSALRGSNMCNMIRLTTNSFFSTGLKCNLELQNFSKIYGRVGHCNACKRSRN
jgi:hypothetical protein